MHRAPLLQALTALLAIAVTLYACDDEPAAVDADAADSATAQDGQDIDTDALADDTGADRADASDADQDLDAALDFEVTPPAQLPAEDCDTTRRPIVFVHGFLAASDTWARTAQLLASNGYCRTHVAALDWNTLAGVDPTIDTLDALIDATRAATGAAQVDLVGHSMGGALSYAYLAQPEHAGKVARYAHVGSLVQSGPAGPAGEIPTLNVWSPDDAIVTDKGDIPGATNAQVPGADHFEVATSVATFVAIYRHLTGGDPATTVIATEAAPALRGRVLGLGENTPRPHALIAIYELEALTGRRATAEPVAVLETDEDAVFGPFIGRAGVFYELHVLGARASDRDIHYYREPFVRSDLLMVLHTMPPSTSLVGVLLAGLPATDQSALTVVFTASHASVFGRDTLTADGVDLATEALAAPERTAIATFLYDDGRDGVGAGEPTALFAGFPFLNGVDLYLPADEAQPTVLEHNGRKLRVPRWPSRTGGYAIAVFD